MPKVSEQLANVFYELICGTTAGHMANVPNDPTLYAVVRAATGGLESLHACSKDEFANLLLGIAEQLNKEAKF